MTDTPKKRSIAAGLLGSSTLPSIPGLNNYGLFAQPHHHHHHDGCCGHDHDHHHDHRHDCGHDHKDGESCGGNT